MEGNPSWITWIRVRLGIGSDDSRLDNGAYDTIFLLSHFWPNGVYATLSICGQHQNFFMLKGGNWIYFNELFFYELETFRVAFEPLNKTYYTSAAYEQSFFNEEKKPWTTAQEKQSLYLGALRIATFAWLKLYKPKSGLLFIIHSPDEYPSDSSYFMHNHFQYTTLQIDLELVLIGEDLKSISSERRNCFFDHEKRLDFFKVYTKENCEHEHQSRKYFEKCGCVPFYLISKFFTRTITGQDDWYFRRAATRTDLWSKRSGMR